MTSSRHTTLLQCYQAIATLSAQMVEGAQAQRWDDVVRIGRQYCEAIEQLKAFGPLDDEQKEARRQLLGKILEDDALIRQLISPELDRLGHLLGDSRRRRNILRTYRSTVRPG